ncbi:MAG TPA: D-alanine--D-alanine ligase [Candidatus Krumholzibacteria bacterium]|nr:D-alanine--D-alanine ligase [Candidatus Krumholzibacteria bacterium]HPD73151.1 D-alanine--D-alanine ligase [Candidatus Krumholzibacteria bacterium]HRY41971.1 D-alanine--D-alanine ligase [Candidatus Krumholzibacteria bacterium]
MKIGLTYDLRDEYLKMGYGEEETAEFDRASTVEAIEGALRRLGHQPDRIGHARQLIARLLAGDRWNLVFNIAEGLHGIGREAQVPCLLDLYDIPYTFSDPMVMALSLHKGHTKRVLRDGGLPTPAFAVIDDLAALAGLDLPFPLFAKPVAEGTGKGIDAHSVLQTAEELHRRCALLLERYRQPVLVERYLPGREFTVGIAGTGPRAEVLGTLEVVLLEHAEAGSYGYENKERCEELVEYRPVRPTDPVVRAAEATSLAAWRLLGCRDAGRIDLRADERGEPQLMELNPLAGLHPEHSDLPMICTAFDVTYDTLIGRIVASAAERLDSTPAA